MTLIEHLFTSYADAPALTEAEEAALIESAQAGSSGAQETLLLAYGPAIRAAVANFGHGILDGRTARGSNLETGNRDLDVEDLRQAAVLAFLEGVQTHDATVSPRLAGRAPQILAKALSESFREASGFAVPGRTLARFYGILKAFDGDAVAAEAAAPGFEMSRETFRQIYASLRGTGSLDQALDAEDGTVPAFAPIFTPSPVADVEDRILVDVAFRALDDEEERIVSLSYGFTEYDPVPDGEIAHRMGLTRPTVQRKRGKALVQMRKALGVTLA